MKKLVVIGGGLVGLGAARKMRDAFPNTEITVLEKEAGFGRHQSTHNSGVLHAGLYYKPGSVKARMAVTGVREMTAFCREHGVAHEICGKVVVAVDETEVDRLKTLLDRGQQNGLAGLRWLKQDELREREPHVAGIAGVEVPEEGIVDYAGVVAALVRQLKEDGVELRAGAGVSSIEADGHGWRVVYAGGELTADFLVNCAGLHCDKVSQLAGEPRATRIVPFRGEYFELKPERSHLVKHLIYPVPDPAFPFLGVHFTRMIHGGVEAGPNAILATAREGYRKSDINFGELLDALTFPGLWRFMRQHGSMAWDEIRRSFSKELFCASLQRLVPEIGLNDLGPGGAGVRAQAMTPQGTLVQDFAFIARANALHVLNAPSPGATASLAIGSEIVTRIQKIRGS